MFTVLTENILKMIRVVIGEFQENNYPKSTSRANLLNPSDPITLMTANPLNPSDPIRRSGFGKNRGSGVQVANPHPPDEVRTISMIQY